MRIRDFEFNLRELAGSHYARMRLFQNGECAEHSVRMFNKGTILKHFEAIRKLCQ